MERSRARREAKNYTPDAEYNQKEFEERYRTSLSENLEGNADEKDYIVEEDNEESDSYRN